MKLIASEEGIYLLFKPLVKAEAIVIHEDQVVAAGAYEKLSSLPGISEEIVFKKPLGPGFVDSHLHLDSLGFEVLVKELHGGNISSILEELKHWGRKIGEWVVSGRLNPVNLEEGRLPLRSEIDRFIDSKPVLIIHQSGHVGVLNTLGVERALSILGSVEGLDVESGTIYESSLWKLLTYIRSKAGESELIDAFSKGFEVLENNGVSAIGLAGIRLNELEALINFYRREKVAVRTYAYILVEELISRREELKSVLKLEHPRKLSIRGIKILIDGALGPRTAFLSDDYADTPGFRGVCNVSVETVEHALRFSEKQGLQLAMHAIGDAALDIALEALRSSVNPAVHRIEHASLVRDDQLDLIKVLKPVIVVQPRFILSDKWMLSRVGAARIKWVYRFKTLSKVARLALSTDSPVEPVAPFETVYAAVSRGLRNGVEYGYDHSSEALTVLEALDSYTRGGAYALRDERLGCLLPGCYPDVVEYSDDPLKTRNIDELRNISVKLISSLFY
ncbi:MAG: amidohydrolase [Thermosphaera sp.]